MVSGTNLGSAPIKVTAPLRMAYLACLRLVCRWSQVTRAPPYPGQHWPRNKRSPLLTSHRSSRSRSHTKGGVSIAFHVKRPLWGPPGLSTGSWGEGSSQERGCEVRAEPRVAEGRARKGDPRRGRSAGTWIRCRRGEAGGPSRISPGGGGGGGGRKQRQALGLPAGQNLRFPQGKPSQKRFFSDEV